MFGSTLVFLYLFVFQQIYSFVWFPTSIREQYWQAIYVIMLLLSFFLIIRSKKEDEALRFLVVCVVFSLITFLGGKKIGQILVTAMSAVWGMGGYLYLKRYKVVPNVFAVFLVFLYVFFYLVYFKFRELNVALENEAFLFGHSSSNAISIALNFVLWVYYFVDYISGSKNIKIIFIFSIINLILVFIQASRMGLVVAIVMFFLVYFTLSRKSESKLPKYIFYIVIIFALYNLPSYLGFLMDYAEVTFLGLDFKDEPRIRALDSFFNKMDLSSALFGYGESVFDEYTRVYNSFLDFWNRYGLVPFIMLLIMTFKRIIYRNKYSASIIVFVPLLLNSMTETVFGGTLWDFCLFLFLFYGYNEINSQKVIFQRNHKR